MMTPRAVALVAVAALTATASAQRPGESVTAGVGIGREMRLRLEPLAGRTWAVQVLATRRVDSTSVANAPLGLGRANNVWLYDWTLDLGIRRYFVTTPEMSLFTGGSLGVRRHNSEYRGGASTCQQPVIGGCVSTSFSTPLIFDPSHSLEPSAEAGVRVVKMHIVLEVGAGARLTTTTDGEKVRKSGTLVGAVVFEAGLSW